MEWTNIISVLSAAAVVGTVIVSIWRARHQNERDASGATEEITGAAIELVEQYRLEVGKLRARIEEAESTIRVLQVEIDELKQSFESSEKERTQVEAGARLLYDQVLASGKDAVYVPPGVSA